LRLKKAKKGLTLWKQSCREQPFALEQVLLSLFLASLVERHSVLAHAVAKRRFQDDLGSGRGVGAALRRLPEALGWVLGRVGLEDVFSAQGRHVDDVPLLAEGDVAARPQVRQTRLAGVVAHAELCEKVLLLTVSVPVFSMPPPLPGLPPPPLSAELLEKVVLLTESVPALSMAPPLPLPAELLERVLLLTVSVPWKSL
jgi:hypothetical protein